MIKKWYTLDQALTWIGSAALMVLFIPTALYLTRNVAASVEQELMDRGQSLAKALAPQLVEPILWNDNLVVHEVLHRAANADVAMIYFFVENVDEQNSVGHSPDFTGSSDLMKLWKEDRGRVIRFRTQDGPVLDVSAPILDGQLGYLHVGLSRSSVAEAINRLRWLLGLELAAAVMVVLAGARIMSAQVSRPLHRLESMVSRFPQHSLGKQDLRLSKIPELNSLGKGFQEMAGRLEALQREQAETQMAMIRAERLATVGELSAGLAHEICNPLDGMQECLRYLEADPDKSPRAAKYYPMLREGFQRIGSVMGGMLTFARSGQKVTPKPYPVSDILEDLKLLLLAGDKDGKVNLHWQCEDQCVCLCEPQGLAQASLNLILNATEAAAQSTEPQVRIHAECNSHWVLLSVEDSGPGISGELRERIFDAFFTTKPMGKGTGLGLSVSRQLIRAVGGELELLQERSSLGGAKFLIRLPKAQHYGETQ
jgi:two-component system NtrC family sensor kinase